MRKDKLISEILGEENTITPSDLYSTEFKNALVGGYDKAEVDGFLERVGDAFEALINQTRSLKEELDGQRTKIEELRDMETTLRNALVSAQKFSQDARDAARREADALLGEARLEKNRVRMSYNELPAALREEIRALRAARDRVRADIRAMLATHSALLYEIPSAEDEQDVALPPFEPDTSAEEDDAPEEDAFGEDDDAAYGEEDGDEPSTAPLRPAFDETQEDGAAEDEQAPGTWGQEAPDDWRGATAEETNEPEAATTDDSEEQDDDEQDESDYDDDGDDAWRRRDDD